MYHSGDDVPELSVDAVAPGDAFQLLGNETRMAILTELAGVDSPVRFSALKASVNVDSGNLNYHLQQLADFFVRRTDAGYELSERGRHVMRAVLAGAINVDVELDPVVIDEQCPFCGAPVEVSYRDDHVKIRCTNCEGVVNGEKPDGTYMDFVFPPAALTDRSPGEIVQTAHTFYDAKLTPMFEGVCPECASAVDGVLHVCDDHDYDGLCDTCSTRFPAWATYTCTFCGYRRRCVVWFNALRYPAVISFLYRHDVLTEPVPFAKMTREHAAVLSSVSTDVVGVDDPAVEVTFAVGGDELVVDINESAEVVATHP